MALAGFSHPAAIRPNFKWSMEECLWIAPHVTAIAANHPQHRHAVIQRAISEFQSVVQPAALRRGIVHGDANDYNVLTRTAAASFPEVCALIDFGDAHEGWIIADVAVAAAYAILGHDSPLQAAAEVLQTHASMHAAVESRSSRCCVGSTNVFACRTTRSAHSSPS